MFEELDTGLLHFTTLLLFCHLSQRRHERCVFFNQIKKTANDLTGICMLLTILEEQAMDSLLLGSDKQNDFMQSILHTMERQSDGNNLYLRNAFEYCDVKC